MLIDTIDRYCELCNYISKIVHKLYLAKPINNDHVKLVGKNRELHDRVHRKYPDINANLIPLAFRKVTRAYKYKKTPEDAYSFSGILDCSRWMVSIKFVMQSPNNIGMLTIFTSAVPQRMHFTFDNAKREEFSNVFNKVAYREYLLTYKDNKFYLSGSIKEDQVKHKCHDA